jgi:hypothetical protein
MYTFSNSLFLMIRLKNLCLSNIQREGACMRPCVCVCVCFILFLRVCSSNTAEKLVMLSVRDGSMELNANLVTSIHDTEGMTNLIIYH